MKLYSITNKRLVPVDIHKPGELPEGLESAAAEHKPAIHNVALYRIADTRCYVWALDGVHLSPILIEELQNVVAVVG